MINDKEPNFSCFDLRIPSVIEVSGEDFVLYCKRGYKSAMKKLGGNIKDEYVEMEFKNNLKDLSKIMSNVHSRLAKKEAKEEKQKSIDDPSSFIEAAFMNEYLNEHRLSKDKENKVGYVRMSSESYDKFKNQCIESGKEKGIKYLEKNCLDGRFTKGNEYRFNYAQEKKQVELETYLGPDLFNHLGTYTERINLVFCGDYSHYSANCQLYSLGSERLILVENVFSVYANRRQSTIPSEVLIDLLFSAIICKNWTMDDIHADLLMKYPNDMKNITTDNLRYKVRKFKVWFETNCIDYDEDRGIISIKEEYYPPHYIPVDDKSYTIFRRNKQRCSN